MPDPVIVTVNGDNPLAGDNTFRDDILTFGGATTYPKGTILARDSATNKLIAFVKGGNTNGNGVPKAVLSYAVTSTGAGDVRIRPCVGGFLRRERLVIIADGNATNIDEVVVDQLRDYNFQLHNAVELNIADNS